MAAPLRSQSILSILPPLVLLIATTLAYVTQPYGVFDCSNPNFQVIYTACVANDYTRCCAIGTACCAGGCCNALSSCIDIGKSTERCCGVGDGDPTICGLYPSESAGATSVLPTLGGQSVICYETFGYGSYTCPPGSKCNSQAGTCILPSGSTGGSSVVETLIASSSVESTPQAPTTVYVTPAPSSELMSTSQVALTSQDALTVTVSAPSSTSRGTGGTTTTPAGRTTVVITQTPAQQTGWAARADVGIGRAILAGLWLAAQGLFVLLP